MTNYETVAKQVGVTPSAIERRVNLVLSENETSWGSMDESDKTNRAIRIAARQLLRKAKD